MNLKELIKVKKELNKLRQKEINKILAEADSSKYLTGYKIGVCDDLID